MCARVRLGRPGLWMIGGRGDDVCNALWELEKRLTSREGRLTMVGRLPFSATAI